MAAHDRRDVLVQDDYDSDAPSVTEASLNDDEHESLHEAQRVTAPDAHDRAILEENEEQEQLLDQSSSISGSRKATISGHLSAINGKIAARDGRRKRRDGRSSGQSEKHGRPSEEGELMYEMEEGVKDLSSRSSSSSLDFDRQKWAAEAEKKTKKTTRRWTVVLCILVTWTFFALAYGAYRGSKHYRQSHTTALDTLSNGTHLFAPTTILISLDGFRADFLHRDLTPALNAFIASGVSPRYILPSFPSVTFPNHFTLVTGLYPESHGVVGNQFWDPKLQEEFYYTDPARSMQPKWWTAEPIWVTAENQGVRTAIHMWPGSEAHIPDVEPTFIDKFNETEVLTRKVDRILNWLDLPGDQDVALDSTLDRRPQLISAYVPDVDAMGHLKGPNSTEIRATISDVDSMLTLLTEGLLGRNLTEIVNIVIVSDHGMATTSTSRLIQLDNVIDISLVDHIDGWPLAGLRLKDPERDLPVLYETLQAAANWSDGFDVYTLETMPEHYHFTNNDRIAPLWVMPRTGWGVVTKEQFDVAEAETIGKVFHPQGMHGYDHEHPLMRAIFVARGPAFPHAPNSRVPVFQNIEVYNIICDSLGIKPHPNNGTLRLPLKTVGLHSDPDVPPPDMPHDPPANTEIRPGHMERPDQEDPAEFPDAKNETAYEGLLDTGSDGEAGQNKGESKTSWWDFIHGQLEKAKEWAKELVEAIKGNEKGSKDKQDNTGAG